MLCWNLKVRRLKMDNGRKIFPNDSNCSTNVSLG